MNGDIIIEFENITKYPLISFLKKYMDFMLNDYSAINSYFGGKTSGIENSHLVALKEITTECKDVLAQFKNFSNRFGRCGYWELMDYLDDLNNTIEMINKLPKFLRTSLSKRGYTPTIQVTAEVGGMKTIDDVANAVSGRNNDETSWIDLMLNNDFDETDWEIDKLSDLQVYVDNLNKVVVTTIIDMPIGDRVYGKDIAMKIGFSDNDLHIVERKDNIEQKCDILLTLKQGDVPENMLFGVNPNLTISDVKGFSYPEIVTELQNTFLQDDLFDSVVVSDMQFAENGNMEVNVKIKTKYDYQTEKKVVI